MTLQATTAHLIQSRADGVRLPGLRALATLDIQMLPALAGCVTPNWYASVAIFRTHQLA